LLLLGELAIEDLTMVSLLEGSPPASSWFRCSRLASIANDGIAHEETKNQRALSGAHPGEIHWHSNHHEISFTVSAYEKPWISCANLTNLSSDIFIYSTGKYSYFVNIFAIYH
jgi:hypothetical protein